MDYAEFKNHLTTFLWKDNDTTLIASLDSLIRMAEAELNRELPIEQRIVDITLAPTTETIPVPADYRSMISLNNLASRGRSTSNTMVNQTKTSVLAQRKLSQSSHVVNVYCVENRQIHLVGPFSAEWPGELHMTYRANFPDFRALDVSYLADEYLDLYTYTVLSHSAPFLREDERVPMWTSLKMTAIESTLKEDKWDKQYGGSPLGMSNHRPVPRR